MLAGRLPFLGPEARDYLEQHVREAPPPLDAVAPHVVPYPLLVKLVMSCLEKKAANRPRDGAALVEALRSVLPADQLALSTQTRLVLSAVTTQTLTAVKDTATSFSQRGMQGVKTMGRLARRLDRPFKVSLLVTVLLTSLVPLAWALWPQTTVERAEGELFEGRPAEALTTIDAVLADSKGLYPTLLSLKAGALHELGREEDARALLRQWPYQSLFPARAAVLELLCEGFAASEVDAEVVEWLALLPPALADETLRRFAKEGPSARQWGALRYLDTVERTRGLHLPERYAASLKSKDCSVRARSAVRLGELADVDAIPALRELSETPKDRVEGQARNCGQDEAGEAIRTLKGAR